MQNSCFKICKIKDVVQYLKTGFASGKDNQANKENGIVQIRPTNINNEGLLIFDKNIYVPNVLLTCKENIIKIGEILFNNTNSQELVGKTAYFDLKDQYFCSNHITRIGVNRKIKPKFLALLLNLYQQKKVFFNTCVNWNNQSGINIQLLQNYKIPLPPLEVQEKVIQIMDNAYEIKKQKELEAKKILDSIDLYLLDELGIKLPEKKNDLKHRIWIKNWSEISGNRFDSQYNQSYYKELEKALENGKYPSIKLLNLLEKIKKGVEVGTDSYSFNKEIPFIRVSDISSNGIDFDNVDKFISYSLYKTLKNDFQVEKNELLYSKDGTIGLCLQPDYKKPYVLSNGILRLILNKKCNLLFAKFFLSSKFFNILSDKESIGSIIKHLNINKFLNLKVPFPRLEIQEKIAKEIERKRTKALNLENEAKSILEQAKKEIEKIILGEEDE